MSSLKLTESIRFFFLTTSSICSFQMLAGTYYVAIDGMDAIGRGDENNPFETIQYAIDAAEPDSTIWVAPGTYDKGYAINRLSSGIEHTNRVSLTKKIHLKSTGGAAVTFIVGSPDPNTGGTGPAAIRCMVSPNGDSNGSTVSGFTLCNGYSGTSLYGGGFLQQSGNKWIYFQDCVISNCLGYSSAGARGGTFARCLFINNRTTTHNSTCPTAGDANFVNCVITSNGDNDSDFTLGSYSILVNCTVACNRGAGMSKSSKIYNTIVCGNSNYDYIGTLAYNCAIGGYSVLSPLNHDWRVVSGSAADGQGQASYIAEISDIFPVVAGMADVDFAGGLINKSAEKISIGAVQAKALATGGVLALTGPFLCDGVSVPDGVTVFAQSEDELAQWRINYARKRIVNSSTNYLRCISHKSGAESVTLFPDFRDSIVMMAPAKSGQVATNTPVYCKALWVDAETGSDIVNDGTESKPYGTIQKAVDVGGADTVVFLAPGLYEEGGKSNDNESAAPYGSYRVWIGNSDVRIVGVDGAAHTIIAGEFDQTTGGLGDNAVKCIGGSGSDVVVQGVTLSNGWTRVSSKNFGKGAAVRDVTLTDSIVKDCCACDCVIYQADLYRCRIYGNESHSNSLFATVNNSKPVRVVCSWFGPNISRSSNYYGYIGSACEAWFSTLIVVNGQSAFSQNGTKIYNSLAVGGKYVKAAMISKGNLFWNFSEVDAAAQNTFLSVNPRLALDKIHVKVDSPACEAGFAPTESRYDAHDEIALKWRLYSSADVDGNLLQFNADGTCMVGAAHDPVAIRGLAISFR